MNYKFDLPPHHKSIIKVIGVGGGGSNAVNYMYQQGIQDVEFIVCNTDAQALRTSSVPNKLQIGTALTDGLGAGTNPDRGKQSAIEDREKIREALTDTKMLFVTAGMGGGTGTGAAPVIAKIAKEMEILTVGIVTLPFTFEGRKKRELADLGINELKAYCDTVIVILNDKIREIFGNLNLKQAFSQADNILTTAAKSIAEIITNPGLINIDFEDVNMVMKEAGAAVMGCSETEGKDRAQRAAELALNSPLLNNTDIRGAKKILVSITVSDIEALSMDEYGLINDYFQETAGMEALLKCGVSIDPNLGDKICVTVIATGFDNQELRAPAEVKVADTRKVIDLESEKVIVQREETIYHPAPSFEVEKEAPTVIESFNGIFARADEREKVVVNLDGPAPVPVQPSLFDEQEYMKTRTVDFQKIEIDKQKKVLEEKYYERKQRITELTTCSNLKPEDFKERLEVPAFERKKVSLQDVPHSSERVVSRFNLNEDNEILGNNKFLYDNVD